MQIADGIHRLTQGVTNFYLVEQGQRLVLVDAGTPKDWNVLIRSISSLGYDIADLEAVLLTHAHADHTGFAERARGEAGAGVWIHEDDERAVKTGDVGKPDGKMASYLFRAQMYRTMLSLGRRGPARIIPVREVSSFSDDELLDVPGKPRVIHAPGHTEGSCALFLESSHILFAGDVLTTWNPLTGDPGPQIMPSGMNHDTEQAMRSLGALDGVPADTVLPGHGEPWTGGLIEAIRLAREAGVT